MSGSFGVERFQAIDDGPRDFYQESIYAPGWTITDQGPSSESHLLKNYLSGNSLIKYEGGQSRDMILPVLDFDSDGVRFSYFKEAGDFLIQLNTR